MKIYKIKEASHKVIKDGEETYISDGFSSPEEISLEDLDNIGFHFTPERNSASISATGLRPKIGSNSSGELGKEATEKTFFSNGIDGTMQIFNRVINISVEAPLRMLQEDEERREDLTEAQKDPARAHENLSIIEAFEYARKYMSGNRYFVFNLVETMYGKQIDESNIAAQIDSINSRLDNIQGISVSSTDITDEDKSVLMEILKSTISNLETSQVTLAENQASEKEKSKVATKISRYKNVKKMLEDSSENGRFSVSNPITTIEGLDKLISDLSQQSGDLEPAEKEKQTELMKKINKLRAGISIEVRRESKKIVDAEIRGKVKPESMVGANFERIDFNEDSLNWVDFQTHPHNCHTLVLDSADGIKELTEPKGVKVKDSDVRLLSLDGKTPASSLDIIQVMYEALPEERRERFAMHVPGRTQDNMLIGKFLEYVKLYKECIVSPEEFTKRALKLQDEVVEMFPKIGDKRKSSEDDLRKFRAEILQRNASTNKKEADEYEL